MKNKILSLGVVFLMLCSFVFVNAYANAQELEFGGDFEELNCATRYLDERAYCYLTIPDIELVVPCYYSLGGYEAQSIVDAENSACILSMNGLFYIGDHKNQGFDAIKKCEVGDKMYLTYRDGDVEYECVKVDKEARNLIDGIYDVDDNLICYDECVICYTCNDYHPWVTAVCFVPLEE